MAVTISFYDQFVEFVGDGGIDLDSDTFDIILMDATHVFTQANVNKADISANEIATAFGYTQGAKTLASVTWASAAAVQTFDAADITWTASGGSIAATDAVIYSETSTAPSADLLMCSIDFDGLQTAGDGTNFVITFNASGIFTIS